MIPLVETHWVIETQSWAHLEPWQVIVPGTGWVEKVSILWASWFPLLDWLKDWRPVYWMEVAGTGPNAVVPIKFALLIQITYEKKRYSSNTWVLMVALTAIMPLFASIVALLRTMEGNPPVLRPATWIAISALPACLCQEGKPYLNSTLLKFVPAKKNESTK